MIPGPVVLLRRVSTSFAARRTRVSPADPRPDTRRRRDRIRSGSKTRAVNECGDGEREGIRRSELGCLTLPTLLSAPMNASNVAQAGMNPYDMPLSTLPDPDR